MKGMGRREQGGRARDDRRSGLLRVLVRFILRLFPEDIPGISRSEMEETFFDGYRTCETRTTALRFLLGEIPNLMNEGLGARLSARERLGILSGLADDLRFAIKTLHRQPALSLGALLMLALGIGLNTAAFSLATGEAHIVDRFEDPGGLVFLWGVESGWDQAPVPGSEYTAWRVQATAFQEMGCYLHTYRYLMGSEEPLRARVAQTSVNLLPMLGLSPELGRLFGSADEAPSAPAVALLTHRLWQERYGGRPDIVGQAVLLNEVPHTVVGVLPAEVEFEMLWRGVSVFTPLDVEKGALAGDEVNVFVMARLARGATVDRAEAQITAIAARLAATMPDSYSQTRARAQPFREFFLPLDEKLAWLATLAAVSAVLIIACVNLANLLMARGATRQGEVAVRMAVGASRARMIRQLLFESLLLASVGGVLGIVLGQWGLTLFFSANPSLPVLREEIGLDLALLSYTSAISVTAALAFGLTPALLTSRVSLVHRLKEAGPGASSGRRRKRFRSWILTTQLALTVPLVLTCAVSFLNVRALQQTDFRFPIQNLLTAQVSLPIYRYPEPIQQARVFGELVDAVRSVPGVTGAAVGPDPPIGPGPGRFYAPLLVEGREEMEGEGRGPNGYQTVSKEYFATLGVPFVSGRGFDDRDGPSSPVVAVVNEAFARFYWPEEDPLGKRLLPETDPTRTNSGSPFADGVGMEVVGVVEDFGATFYGEAPQPALYLSQAQFPTSGLTLVVRTRGDLPNLAWAIREAVANVDPGAPVNGFRTGEGMVHDWLRESRTIGGALGLMAVLALGMAVLGLYGMVAYSVARRTFELGVRMVLGAGKTQVRLSVMGSYLAQSGIGIFIGILISVALGMVARSFLILLQVSYLPMTVGITGLLMGVTILAAYLPARRATLIQPVVALRSE